MHRIICLSLLSMTLALPVYAGQTIIKETETGITVEYKPDAEDSKAAVIMKEQDEKATVVEQAKQARIEEKLARQRARNPKNEDGSDAE
jgi:hypothetical protein